MKVSRRPQLHAIENAGLLESKFRRLVQNPEKIISRYIEPGMKVLDLGCGTGYFTTQIAKRLNDAGKVIAADVQKGMLAILAKKVEGFEFRERIEILLCKNDRLSFNEKFDFILCFYSFHEMEYLDDIIQEIAHISKPYTKILIAEQKFHVPKKLFLSFVEKMQMKGFKIIERPKIFLSRAVLMQYV